MSKRTKHAPERSEQGNKCAKPLPAMGDELAELERRMREAIARRDAADTAGMAVCDKIVEAVKAEEGEDSEFYAAIVFAGLETEGGVH